MSSSGSPVSALVHSLAGADAGSRTADSTLRETDGGLRAAGQKCFRCRRRFDADDPVRRIPGGELVHDVC